MQQGIDHLHQARDNFANAAKKLGVQQKSASSQIDTLLFSVSEKLKSECHDQLSEKKGGLKSEVQHRWLIFNEW